MDSPCGCSRSVTAFKLKHFPSHSVANSATTIKFEKRQTLEGETVVRNYHLENFLSVQIKSSFYRIYRCHFVKDATHRFLGYIAIGYG